MTEKTTVSVMDVVMHAIKQAGADGLYNEMGCGCGPDDLQSCGTIEDDCQLAKRCVLTQQEIDNNEYGCNEDYEFKAGDIVYRPIMVEK